MWSRCTSRREKPLSYVLASPSPFLIAFLFLFLPLLSFLSFSFSPVLQVFRFLRLLLNSTTESSGRVVSKNRGLKQEIDIQNCAPTRREKKRGEQKGVEEGWRGVEGGGSILGRWEPQLIVELRSLLASKHLQHPQFGK